LAFYIRVLVSSINYFYYLVATKLTSSYRVARLHAKLYSAQRNIAVVILSVRPSLTSRHYVKTAKAIWKSFHFLVAPSFYFSLY